MRALALAFALFATPAVAQVVSPADVAHKAIEEMIRPGFTDAAQQAGELQGGLVGFCANATPYGLDLVRGMFADAAVAYGRVEWLRFGPLAADNRPEKLLLWPDRKGIMLKQVQEALVDKDQSVLDPAQLAGKSVALRGFVALEFLLFGTGSENLATGDAYRCGFAQSVATAIANELMAVHDEWTPEEEGSISARLEHPAASDPDYRSVREVLEELVGQMTFGIEAIRDQRILPVIGRERFDPKPKSALFWRSGLTLDVIRANFEGIAELYAMSRIGAAGEGDSTWLENSVVYAFDNAVAILDKIPGPVEAALADEAQVRALEALLEETTTLQNLIGGNTATVLNLSVGFSSLDGD